MHYCRVALICLNLNFGQPSQQVAREAKGDKTRENCWLRGSSRALTPTIGGSGYWTSSSKVGEVCVRGFSTAVSGEKRSCTGLCGCLPREKRDTWLLVVLH